VNRCVQSRKKRGEPLAKDRENWDSKTIHVQPSGGETEKTGEKEKSQLGQKQRGKRAQSVQRSCSKKNAGESVTDFYEGGRGKSSRVGRRELRWKRKWGESKFLFKETATNLAPNKPKRKRKRSISTEQNRKGKVFPWQEATDIGGAEPKKGG